MTNLHLMAAAEKLRIAGELARDAADLLRRGGVVNCPAEAERARLCQRSLNLLWLDLAVILGTDYAAALDESRPEGTARKLAEIFALALQIPRDEIEALLTNPRFLFKPTAEAVLAIQDELTVQSIAQASPDSKNAECGTRNAERGPI